MQEQEKSAHSQRQRRRSRQVATSAEVWEAHRMVDIRKQAPVATGAAMAVIGSAHFLIPAQMEATIPAFIPRKRELLYLSGAIEVTCGLGLIARRPWAAKLAAATLLAVWPANVQMALDAGKGKLPAPIDNKVALWARVPLQLPMIWAVLQGRRG